MFLNFLIPKLPAPEEPDLSKGILERIDMDSYRVVKHRTWKIILEEDAEIDPVSMGEGGGKGAIETDRLSAIIEEFNDLFGGIEWADRDRINRTVTVGHSGLGGEGRPVRERAAELRPGKRPR